MDDRHAYLRECLQRHRTSVFGEPERELHYSLDCIFPHDPESEWRGLANRFSLSAPVGLTIIDPKGEAHTRGLYAPEHFNLMQSEVEEVMRGYAAQHRIVPSTARTLRDVHVQRCVEDHLRNIFGARDTYFGVRANMCEGSVRCTQQPGVQYALQLFLADTEGRWHAGLYDPHPLGYRVDALRPVMREVLAKHGVGELPTQVARALATREPARVVAQRLLWAA